jgi:putative cell wall-binding protein
VSLPGDGSGPETFDAQLAYGKYIAGHVVDVEGVGIENVVVQACFAVATWACATAVTDDAGKYTLTGLSPAIDYVVSFEPRQFTSGGVITADSLDYLPGDQQTISVPAGDEGATVDATLKKGAQYRGSVIDAATGLPVQGLRIAAWPTDFFENPVADRPWRFTDADGQFTTVGLAPGNYFLAMESEYGDGYATMNWGSPLGQDVPTVFTVGSEDLGTVTDLPDAPFKLLHERSLNGTVSGAGAEISVIAHRLNTDGTVAASILAAKTRSDGTFSTRSLVTGRYLVQFVDKSGEHPDAWYGGSAMPTTVDVPEHEFTTGIDASMTSFPELGAPTNVAATAFDGSAMVTFDPPATTGGKRIVGYDVAACLASADANACLSGDPHVEQSTGTSVVITDLTNDSDYVFAARARVASRAGDEVAGPWSTPSAAVTPTAATGEETTPTAPVNVEAELDTADPSEVTVSWDAPAFDGRSAITGYRVIPSPACAACDDAELTTDGTEQSAVITGLATGVAYTFTVVATNEHGDGDPSTASSPVIPVAPLPTEEIDEDITDGSDATVGDSTDDDSTPTTATATGSTGTIAFRTFTTNPAAPVSGEATAKFFDVQLAAGSSVTKLVIKQCGVAEGKTLQWWDPIGGPDWAGAWIDVIGDPTERSGDCVSVTITAESRPSLGEMSGTMFAVVGAKKAVEDSSGGPADPGGSAGTGDDGSAPSAAPASSSPVTSNGRVAGENRFETAATVALQFAAADPEFAGNVVIANAEAHKNGFDALSANALAGSLHAPLLLTGRDSLPASTRAAMVTLLEAHGGATIVVMGAADSVSDAVVTEIREAAKAAGVAITITRVAGSNRYATSARAALKAGTPASVALTEGGPKLPTAFLASGEVNADSVAASSASNGLGIPVLLTQSGELPAEIAQAITTLGIRQVVVLGGTDRISPAVEAALTKLGVSSITRVAGPDRFDTSVQLYTLARSLFGQDGSVAYLANGLTGWPDALAAGPLAGATGAPLLTVPVGSLPESVRKFLADNGFTGIVALGKSGTIANSVLDAAQVTVG